MQCKKGAKLARMKAVTRRIFNPLHVLGNKISVSDIDGPECLFTLLETDKYRGDVCGVRTRESPGKEASDRKIRLKSVWQETIVAQLVVHQAASPLWCFLIFGRKEEMEWA